MLILFQGQFFKRSLRKVKEKKKEGGNYHLKKIFFCIVLYLYLETPLSVLTVKS